MKIEMNDAKPISGFTLQPNVKRRRLASDIAWLSRSRNFMRGTTEVDVTDALSMIRDWRNQNNKSLSLTVYLIATVASAVAAAPWVNVSRARNNQVAYFKDVNIMTMVEIPDVDGIKVPTGHLIRAANKIGVDGIQNSLDEFQANYDHTAEMKQLDFLAAIPKPIRRLIYGRKPLDPHFIQHTMGNVLISNVSMFLPHREAWVAGQSNHTIAIWVGSIAEKPVFLDGTVVPRKMLYLTMDFDHDLIDGAPGARFAAGLLMMIEKGTVLCGSACK